MLSRGGSESGHLLSETDDDRLSLASGGRARRRTHDHDRGGATDMSSVGAVSGASDEDAVSGDSNADASARRMAPASTATAGAVGTAAAVTSVARPVGAHSTDASAAVEPRRARRRGVSVTFALDSEEEAERSRRKRRRGSSASDRSVEYDHSRRRVGRSRERGRPRGRYRGSGTADGAAATGHPGLSSASGGRRRGSSGRARSGSADRVSRSPHMSPMRTLLSSMPSQGQRHRSQSLTPPRADGGSVDGGILRRRRVRPPPLSMSEGSTGQAEAGRGQPSPMSLQLSPRSQRSIPSPRSLYTVGTLPSIGSLHSLEGRVRRLSGSSTASMPRDDGGRTDGSRGRVRFAVDPLRARDGISPTSLSGRSLGSHGTALAAELARAGSPFSNRGAMSMSDSDGAGGDAAGASRGVRRGGGRARSASASRRGSSGSSVTFGDVLFVDNQSLSSLVRGRRSCALVVLPRLTRRCSWVCLFQNVCASMWVA